MHSFALRWVLVLCIGGLSCRTLHRYLCGRVSFTGPVLCTAVADAIISERKVTMSAQKRRAQSRVPGGWRVGRSRYKLQSVFEAAVLPHCNQAGYHQANYHQLSMGGVMEGVQQELILRELSDQSKKGHPCPLGFGRSGDFR